ncbi:MAG: site-specific integrase [Nitrospiraceae bacterium]|nr:site-specific integrase [Nitrospiraceae bacterium]
MAKGIYKRGKIFWIRYAGLDGRVIRESTCSSKFKEAESLLISRKEAVKQGKQPEIKKIANHTFDDLIGEYLKWGERQRSFRSKRGFIGQLKAAFGGLPLRRFNTMLVEQYQTEKAQKGNKPATINRHVATLKHMFTKAVDWNMVEEETLKRVRKVKLLEENNRRLRYLSKEECQALICACNDHVRPIVITALNTGMRRGEILSLTWDRVDLKHGFILLDKTKNGDRREIPINDTLKATMQGLTRRLDIPHVFYDPATGKPYQDVKKSFQTACRKAKIQDFHFHDLRHTFASHLVMAGVDLTTVKELLGHKTLTMTLRYSHLAPAHKVKAVNVLDNVLMKGGEEKCMIARM